MEQEAEKAAEDILQAWAAPCAAFVRGLISKARSGLSEHEFRAELAAGFARLPEMELTDDDALLNALWEQGARAYRRGWEGALVSVEGDDVKASSRRCHKAPDEYCREHGWKEGGDEVVKTLRGNRKVLFGNKLKEHFRGKDKDRRERLPDLDWAKEAVRRGKCGVQLVNKEKRLCFKWDFEENGKNYTMKVVCVLDNKKRWQVLTYHRF